MYIVYTEEAICFKSFSFKVGVGVPNLLPLRGYI